MVLSLEHKMIRCAECGKQISEDHVIHCQACGAPFCIEYATNQLCSTCVELGNQK